MSEKDPQEAQTKSLSFAVEPADAFTGEEPVGGVLVFLEGTDKVAARCGPYYTFSDLPEGDYSVVVSSRFYHEAAIVVWAGNRSEAIKVPLYPLPCCPFPSGETLVRGMVRNSMGEVLPRARLTWRCGSEVLKGRATDKGDFVLYFRSLTWENVVRGGGSYYVRGDMGRTKLKVEVEYEDAVKYFIIDRVLVGKTKLIDIKLATKPLKGANAEGVAAVRGYGADRERGGSLVLLPVDSFTGGEPLGQVMVRIEGSDKVAVRCGSHCVFPDPPLGDLRISLSSQFYHDAVLTAKGAGQSIPVRVPLHPLPNYPFSRGETLVRGVLHGPRGEAVSDARLNWRCGEGVLEGRTTEKGEFVLYFGALTWDEIVRLGGCAYVRGDTEKTRINVNIMSENTDGYFIIDRIELGKTNHFDAKLLLKGEEGVNARISGTGSVYRGDRDRIETSRGSQHKHRRLSRAYRARSAKAPADNLI